MYVFVYVILKIFIFVGKELFVGTIMKYFNYNYTKNW